MKPLHIRFDIAWIIVAFALLSPKGVFAGCNSGCINPEEPDDPPSVTITASDNPVRCGTQVTLSASGGVCYCIWGGCAPILCREAFMNFTWGDGPQGEERVVTSQSPGTQTFTATGHGTGECGRGVASASDSIDITWVGIASLTGPSRVCAREWAGFAATTTYPNTDDWITWTTTNDLGNEVTGEGPGFGTLWNTAPATHIVTAKSGTCSKSMRVDVEAPPECESNECNDGSGGGCPNGAGFPMPGLFSPYVPQSLILPQPIGGPGAGLGGNTGLGGCKRDTIEEYRCGGPEGPIIVLYYDMCGNCHRVDFTGCPLPCTFPLGNAGSMTRNPSGSYTVTGADASVRQMSVPPEGPDMVKLSRPTSMTDPNGNVTTFSRDANGGLNSVSLSNGDTWLYTHDPDDDKIRKITAPDNETTTDVTYVESGLAMHQIGTVRVYDRPTEPRNLISDLGYTYDSQGRLTQVTKDGKTVTYDYVVSGPDTVTVTDTSATPQVVTVYDYTPEAGTDKTTITRKHATDPNKDQVTTYTFYTSGGKKTYLYQVTDPLGNTTTYDTYTDGDLKGKVYRLTDALGRQTDYDYDADTGALTKITYPAVGGVRHTEEYTYYLDSQSNKTQWLKTVKNVRGNWTLYVRDTSTLSKLDAVKMGEGLNEPTWSQIDPIRGYEYYSDSSVNGLRGKLLRETVPNIEGTSPKVTEYGYYDTGNELRTGPTTVTYHYPDGQGGYLSGVDQTHYDDMGNVLSTTDQNGRAISHTYDDLGRELTTTYATGRVVESHYNCCALEWTKDEDGRYTYYAYDGAKRVTKMWTNVSGQSETYPLVEYTYDEFGNVKDVKRYTEQGGSARMTTYAYDKNNRVTAIDHPSPLGDESFGYDDVGNLRWKVDGGGVVTLYRYDALNRLTEVYCNYTGSLPPISYPSTADVSYTYVGGSRLRESMTDSTGTSEYEYDFQDRLTEYTPPVPADRTVEYSYNNLSQKTRMELKDTGTSVSKTLYEYYKNGWLKNVKLDTSTIAEYKYDAVGNRTQVDLGNGTYTEYDYDTDPRYRMSGMTHLKDGSPPTELLAITYPDRDGSGNPEQMVDSGGTMAYVYDANSRLWKVTYPGQQQLTNAFDWVGNRLNLPPDTNTLEHNAADQLTRWPGQHQYTYYDTGSLHQQYDDSSPRVLQKTYTYTPANLLQKVVHGDDPENDPASEMEWDADSNRILFTSSTGGTSDFVYDTTAGNPAVIEEYNGSASVYYVRDPDGELIARLDGAVRRYYHFDELGSTRLLTDASGTVTDIYSYDAWGVASHTSGTTGQPYQFIGRLGYYSHFQDPNLSLLQLGVRFYDQETGSFTQRDSGDYEDTYAPYLYVLDLPTRDVDPSGLVVIRPPNNPFPCGSGLPGGPGGRGGLPSPPPMQPGNPPDDVWKCARERSNKCANNPRLCPSSNCWEQVRNQHTEGWLTEDRCRCEDVLVCWRRNGGPRGVSETRLYVEWERYCKGMQPWPGCLPYPPPDIYGFTPPW